MTAARGEGQTARSAGCRCRKWLVLSRTKPVALRGWDSHHCSRQPVSLWASESFVLPVCVRRQLKPSAKRCSRPTQTSFPLRAWRPCQQKVTEDRPSAQPLRDAVSFWQVRTCEQPFAGLCPQQEAPFLATVAKLCCDQLLTRPRPARPSLAQVHLHTAPCLTSWFFLWTEEPETNSR